MVGIVHDVMCHAFYGGRKMRKTDETHTTTIYGQYISVFQI